MFIDFAIHQGPSLSKVYVFDSGLHFSLLGTSLKIILSGPTQFTITIDGPIFILYDGSEEVKKIKFEAHRNFEWTHFILSWTEGVLKLSSITDQNILTYDHRSGINFNTVTFEATDNSIWTVHEHFWYDARDFMFNSPEEDCLVLYLSTCKACTMKLRREYQAREESITGVEEKWVKKKLTDLSENDTISLYGIDNGENYVAQYFALDVRKCSSNLNTFILNITENVENGILILKVLNTWNNLVTMKLKLISKNDNVNINFNPETTEGQYFVYRLIDVKSSTTYKTSLYVQTEQDCAISNEIEVHTPPAKLMIGKAPILSCTELKCTIHFIIKRQASEKHFLYLVVINILNETTTNVLANEFIFKRCEEVYEKDYERWSSYKTPFKVIVIKPYGNMMNEEDERTITFEIENSEVSANEIKMLFIDTYYDKITCTLYSVNIKERRLKKVIPEANQDDEGVAVETFVWPVLFSLGAIAVIASIIVYYKKKTGRCLLICASGHQAKPQTRSIQVDDLEEYVKQSIKAHEGGEDELTRQFKLFRSGQTQPWDYGNLPTNFKKHQYKNIFAYDHSRVVLSKLPSDDFSDYINANYVELQDREYIATQGPNNNTTNDFWRMVWEQNSPVIIMLTKLIEGDKVKCEKYWPDESKAYGNIKVSLTYQQYYVNYCTRTFNLRRGNENKRVTHLHYESWPDHGIPDCQSFALFMAAIPPLSPAGPQIVHGSAGCGRTGTFILAQICLKSARQTGQVDFLGSLANIRKNRVDLVQNEDQYKATHLLVLESLFKEDYTVKCGDRMRYDIVNCRIDAEQQVRYLKKVSWRDSILYQSSAFIGSDNNNLIKNRTPLILPPQHSAIIIPKYPLTDSHSDYINAVLIRKFYNSISSQNFHCVETDYTNTLDTVYNSVEFIVTQQPLPNTIGDFWRMIFDKQAEVIVSLNNINPSDQSSCIFWPQSDQEISPTSTSKLQFVRQMSSNEAYDVVTLQASEDNVGRTILIICMKNWNPSESVPRSVRHLLQVVKYVQTLSPGQVASGQPIIVTCYDGATASGLFVSLTITLEMVQIENKFDLSRIVRAIRRSRMEFMSRTEQFRFLYDAVLYCLEEDPAEEQVITYDNEDVIYSEPNNI